MAGAESLSCKKSRHGKSLCLCSLFLTMKQSVALFAALASLLLAGCNDDGDDMEDDGSLDNDGSPQLTVMEFLAADNPRLLAEDVGCSIVGDSVVECWIPSLMDGKGLVPRFTVKGDYAVCDGQRIESGESIVDFSGPKELTVTAGSNKRTYTVIVHAFTGLPVLWIETEGRTEVTSKEEYVRASFRLVEDVVTRSSGSTHALTGQIRGHGNTTWDMPKKSFRLKLDAKASLLGEPSDKSWVLLANYADKTMLRNMLAFRLSGISNLDYTPRSHFVEVMLNGRYNGTYQLCEKLKIDSHRVNVGDGGVLMEIDERGDENVNPLNFKVGHIRNPIFIKEPEMKPDSESLAYARNFMTTVDSVLFSEKFADPSEGWRKYMDMESFVDWYLINEIARNNDAVFFSSCYMSLPRNGRLKMGPLWDFDIAFGNVDYNDNYEPEGFWVRQEPWFDRLFQDPAFVSKVKERFAYFDSHLDEILREMNKDVQYMHRSVVENDARWGTLYTATWPNYSVWGNYQNEVQYMKTWLVKRMEWLRLQFGETRP